MAQAPGVRQVGDPDGPLWDEFVAKQPGASVYHRYVWRTILEQELRCKTYYLLAIQPDGVVTGVLPMARLRSRLFGDFLVSLPYFNYGGPVTCSPAADQVLVTQATALARDLGVCHLELRETSQRPDGWAVRTDKVVMSLALESSAEAQWRTFGAKLRAQIKRPLRERPSMRFGGPELVDDFYRVFARNMRDLGTPVYAKSLFRRITATREAGGEVAVAYLAGKPVAAGVLLHHSRTIEIPWASSLREYNRTGINMYFYWEVLQRAIQQGGRRFDFGRSTVDSGTYRFKAQWGACPTPLYWHYWLARGGALPALSPSNPRFSIAIRLWRRLPVWLANSLGPGIVRHLP